MKKVCDIFKIVVMSKLVILKKSQIFSSYLIFKEM